MSLTQLLFSFRGRINRAIYWYGSVGLLAVFAALASIGRENGGILGAPMLTLAGILLVPFLWAALAVNVKRLHDRGKSSWWLLFFFVLPTFLDIAAERLKGILGLVLLFINVGIAGWVLMELGFAPGTRGPNDYGPDPMPPVPDKPA
jgi:uncharacterized membrane protein YhaH (DUF805 family)